MTDRHTKTVEVNLMAVSVDAACAREIWWIQQIEDQD